MKPASEQIFLRRRECVSIRRLTGFSVKKGHFIPLSVNNYADRFVKNLLTEKIEDELQDLYLKSKQVFNLRRKDLEKATDIGKGHIETQVFRYEVEACQHTLEADKACVDHVLKLFTFSEPTLQAIESLFSQRFEEVVLLPEFFPDFDTIVDRFEELQFKSGGELCEDDRLQTIQYVAHSGTQIFLNCTSEEFILKGNNSLDLISYISEALQAFDLLKVSPKGT